MSDIDDVHAVRLRALLEGEALEPLPVKAGAGDTETLRALFESQLLSRELDHAARTLRRRDVGYYTIGSAGHEGNAVLGRVTRPTDPAFLHYRSGALMLERARHDKTVDAVRDTLLGVVAGRDEPIAGGRHKVWGSRPLWVVPQTSTIASHLPKAVGTAVALSRGDTLPRDSLVLCSFGDASANHSTATGAFNMALWTAYRRLPVPVLFVCEDNGLGISVPTPPGWIEHRLRPQFGDDWFSADGCDVVDALEVATAAVAHCRRTRRPTFLHLRVVRLLGHAGSDVESAYRDADVIASEAARDPLLVSARRLLERGVDAGRLLATWDSARERVAAAIEVAAGAAPLATREEVIAPLAPCHVEAVTKEAERIADATVRDAAWGDTGLPENGPPRHLAVQINRALTDLLALYPEALLFGEDVAHKGGVYNVTPGLQARFGPRRVFDTLLDEQSILGMAQGAALLGALPIPEIQYLAYLHNAIDQLRGEAASLQFFSQGQFRNPMVVRIAGLGYQKGFGGHFHNDNGIAALREIPGLVVACPSRGDDAVGLLRTCMALARVDGRVVVFLEPIALYSGRPPIRRPARRCRSVPGGSTMPTPATCCWSPTATACRWHCARCVLWANGTALPSGCSTCAGWCRSTMPPSRPMPVTVAGSWPSTRDVAAAASVKRYLPGWSSRAVVTCRSAWSPEPTATSRSVRPPGYCCRTRTRWWPRPRRSASASSASVDNRIEEKRHARHR
jgi:2-oxoisovalerate dehydrogenase E1 component